MSKAAKQSIFLLIVLLVACLGFAGYTLLEKQKIESQKVSLERELLASQDREKKNLLQVNQLKDALAASTKEKDGLKKTLGEQQARVEDLLSQIDQISAEGDKWKGRLETIQKERDELLAKLKEKPKVIYKEKIVYKEKEPPAAAPVAAAPAAQPAVPTPPPAPKADMAEETVPPGEEGEKYVAQVLKEKAALEAQIDNLSNELSKRTIEIVDLKQAKDNLKIELDTLKNAKDQVDLDLKQKEDMINSLTLELTRTKNDKNFAMEKAEKLGQQNDALLGQIKDLTDAKNALEKSIVQLTQTKADMEKRLEKTQAAVQDKINEVWKIKNSLDRALPADNKAQQTSGQVELPPIVVNSGAEEGAVGSSSASSAPASNPGFEGKVISINEENNFVIVDVGQKRGLRPGDTLGVYRGQDYIARVEVLQVRPDIAAADLKDQWSKVQVGDTVR